jgi:UDP-GlcNAc:undecaprenyl-phosphate GlcNAc-1-phosphate transferase
MIFLYFLFLSILLFFILNILFVKFKILDTANTNIKKHTKPVPYSGGFVIYLNFLILFFFLDSFLIYYYQKTFLFFLVFSLIFFVGFIDDIFKLPAILRLILLIVIFFFLLSQFNFLKLNYFKFGYPLNLSKTFYSISFFITIFCLLSFVHASNMIDGINCQFGLYFLALIIYSNTIVINYSIYLIPGLIVFLYFNYNNKSFLGDGGCYLISFIIGILFIQLHNEQKIYADKIISVMLMPGLDMIRLFFNRILNKKNPFNGDRNHLHHLIELKFGSSKAIIFSPLIFCAPIFFEYFLFNSFFNIFLSTLIYFSIIFYIHKPIRNKFF